MVINMKIICEKDEYGGAFCRIFTYRDEEK